MAKKTKSAFVCTECGADFAGWAGQCNQCGAWNTIKEVKLGGGKSERERSGYAGSRSAVQLLSEVNLAQAERISTGLAEFDRVLGGGIVKGSVVLIGGAPGAGKSTILLQAVAHIARQLPVLYVSGEESLQQIAERAHRLQLNSAGIKMLAETSVQQICQVLDEEQPQVVIIDSIQVMYTADSDSAPGSVSQVRESASYLTQYAKRTGVSFFMVGHVTKDQSLAGPMTLSHIVDARWCCLRPTMRGFGCCGPTRTVSAASASWVFLRWKAAA